MITSHGGQNGAFTIHSSTDITIAHIIGPAVSSQSIVNNEGDSTTLCVTSSVNPRHSYAIYFKLKGNIIYDHVYFQFIVKFTNIRNERFLLFLFLYYYYYYYLILINVNIIWTLKININSTVYREYLHIR